MFHFSLWYPIVPPFSCRDIFCEIPWELFSHLFVDFECVNVNCVMDVIDVTLSWKQTVIGEDLVIFLHSSQENSAVWPLSILLSAFYFTFYHLYLFGLFQLLPHTYTTQCLETAYFWNIVWFFVCCDNGVLMNISYNTFVKPLSGIYMTLHFTSLVFHTFHCTICIS